MDSINLQQAIVFIKSGGWRILVGYAIISMLIYFAIWAFIEPADIKAENSFLDNIIDTRFKSHVWISLFLGSHVTLILLVVFRFNSLKTKLLYDGTNCTSLQFQAIKERKYDQTTDQRFGLPAEGNFTVVNSVINIERTNSEGEYHLKLQSYHEEQGPYSYIRKDITQDGARRIKIDCQIKISGNGSQDLIFVLKDNSNGAWLDFRKQTVNNAQWALFSVLLIVSYDKDFYLRIDSVGVTNPPISVNVKNLKVFEV